MTLPTPHGDKLQALLRNDKLPNGDRKRIKTAIARYQEWLNQLARVLGDERCINASVNLKNLAVSSMVTSCGEAGSGVHLSMHVKPPQRSRKPALSLLIK